MKKIVLTFGLISGAIMSLMMLIILPFHEAIGFGTGALILGYATMVAASLLIYFGVRTYRDNVAGGTVSFGRALGVGLLIGSIASVCYVATWEVIYFRFHSDYLVKYQAYALEQARAEGASDAELAKQKAELDKWAQLYRNPAINAAVTFLEPLPVVVIFALVSAGILSRRRKESLVVENSTSRQVTERRL